MGSVYDFMQTISVFMKPTIHDFPCFRNNRIRKAETGKLITGRDKLSYYSKYVYPLLKIGMTDFEKDC